MSEINQFAINNRSSYSNQFIIVIEIIQTICNGKTNKMDKKIVEIQRNQSNGNNNINFKRLKFVNFPSIIDQVILINL